MLTHSWTTPPSRSVPASPRPRSLLPESSEPFSRRKIPAPGKPWVSSPVILVHSAVPVSTPQGPSIGPRSCRRSFCSFCLDRDPSRAPETRISHFHFPRPSPSFRCSSRPEGPAPPCATRLRCPGPLGPWGCTSSSSVGMGSCVPCSFPARASRDTGRRRDWPGRGAAEGERKKGEGGRAPGNRTPAS